MFSLKTRIALAVIVIGFAGVPAARGQYARRNAIVEAVDRTRDAIVTLKVFRSDREGVGTGVVIDERGFAVTNNHVVAGATRIVVTFADRTVVDATVHAAVPRHDLAIIRFEVDRKVKALPVASGRDLMVGESVIAVGNPFGYTNSVSTGIISALDRDIPVTSSHTLTGLIQHCANINPGNSGGPLLNVNGELIGINVALRDGAQGIAWAINAETVKDVLATHLSADKLSRVSHGLTVIEKADLEGAARHKVVITAVSDSGARVGLKKGDVIVRLGSLPAQNRFDIERALWGYRAGDTIAVTVLRDGKPSTLELPLASTGG